MYSKFVRYASQLPRMAGALAMLVLLGACSKPAPVVEESIPELALTGLDGARTSLQSFRGKLLVLNVWATWCPPCRKEMPSLERLSKSVDSERIVVAGLSADSDTNAVLEFLGQSGITFRNFIDTPENIANALGVRTYPETLLIGPDGKIAHRISGERDWSSPAMLQMLEDTFQGRLGEQDNRQTGAARDSHAQIRTPPLVLVSDLSSTRVGQTPLTVHNSSILGLAQGALENQAHHF